MLTRVWASALIGVAVAGTIAVADETDQSAAKRFSSNDGAIVILTGELPHQVMPPTDAGLRFLHLAHDLGDDFRVWDEDGFSALAARISDHYIGVSLGNPSETLSSQLRLKPGEGQVVLSVADESPADKAEVQKHDVLIKVDGEAITSHQMLVDAIDEAGKGGREMHFELIRQGEQQKAVITPSKRERRNLRVNPELRRRILRWSPEAGWLRSELNQRGEIQSQIDELREQVEDLKKMIEGSPTEAP